MKTQVNPKDTTVLHSNGNVGQILQGVAQDHASNFLPVPPLPDGWRPRRYVPGAAAEGGKFDNNPIIYIKELPFGRLFFCAFI